MEVAGQAVLDLPILEGIEELDRIHRIHAAVGFQDPSQGVVDEQQLAGDVELGSATLVHDVYELQEVRVAEPVRVAAQGPLDGVERLPLDGDADELADDAGELGGEPGVAVVELDRADERVGLALLELDRSARRQEPGDAPLGSVHGELEGQHRVIACVGDVPIGQVFRVAFHRVLERRVYALVKREAHVWAGEHLAEGLVERVALWRLGVVDERLCGCAVFAGALPDMLERVDVREIVLGFDEQRPGPFFVWDRSDPIVVGFGGVPDGGWVVVPR
jgi:hypothetical protein